MHLRKIALILGLTLTLSIGLIGCKTNTFNTQEEVVSGDVDNENRVHFADMKTGEITTKGIYSQKGKLIEIPIKLKADTTDDLTVETYHGSYTATYDGSSLYYIGEAPTINCPIIRIGKTDVVEKEIPKSEIKNKDGKYKYILSTEEHNIRGLSMVSESGGFIPIHADNGSYIMEISDDIYTASESFSLTIWTIVPVEIE